MMHNKGIKKIKLDKPPFIDIKQVFIGLIPVNWSLSANPETMKLKMKQIIKYMNNLIFGLKTASNGFWFIFLKWKSKILIKINWNVIKNI